MIYTLGILDEELDQLDLIETCFEDSFKIIKIPTIESIDQLIDLIKSEKIDALTIDYKLKENNSNIPYNGDYFFKEIYDKFGDFPAFVLTQDVENAKKESKKINPRFIVDKSKIHSFIDPVNHAKRLEFINELKLEIEVHHNSIQDDINELKALEEILEQGKSLGDQENRYLELNNKLSKSISGYDAISNKYFSKDTLDRLDKLIEQTEALLKKL
jgi:hypothetical protein